MDSLQSELGAASGQARVGHVVPRGQRQCLLKGCECWFWPSCVQARYCSQACQQAACRWRRWCASRRYRVSPQGKERRRAQCMRHRQRQRNLRSSKTAFPGANSANEVTIPVAASAAEVARDESIGLCEGQRAAEIPQEIRKCSCNRPGCYELFVLQARSPDQFFCSSSCRQALRRVIDRERRLRARRCRGIPRRRYRSRRPP